MSANESPRVLVIGATGPTGREVLKRAADAGLATTALVRNAARLTTPLPGGCAVAQGDVLDPTSLMAAMTGVSAVVSLLGTPLLFRRVTLLSEGTRNVVEAMRRSGVTRLLCVTGMGAGDSRGHGGLVYDRLILPTLLRQVYADKDRQEAIVRQSGLQWVLIRPAFLTNRPGTGRYRTITAFGHERMTTIARADVAHFIVDELREQRFDRCAVNLTR